METIIQMLPILIWVGLCGLASEAYISWKISRPENKILELEAQSVKNRKHAEEDPYKFGKEHIKYVLGATERDYLRLKNLFGYDDKKRLELASDWCRYALLARDLPSPSFLWNSTDGIEDDAKWQHNSYFEMVEIERRFQKMLVERVIKDRVAQYIGHKIRQVREFQNITQDELAKKLKVRTKYIKGIEGGFSDYREYSGNLIYDIATALEIHSILI